ncbi:hypothetical protein LAZ67_15001980 [Cordylochernes scorpioides]|uniref:Integrase catalytic domain-containing protein n=1 Tax=Cordylochernes scorpioides TaxID=51811 RepID=A0ABY6LBV3_9ARAC|nr:hypothetical protein LAZ67_15001980 [Cordylochernes scorpioides]
MPSYRSGYLVLGVPAKVTTDQGRQFESALFANGLVERFHRQLKDSLRCHDSTSWSLKLPLVLLGISSSLREDLNTTTAELVYGKPLPLPGTFFEDPPSASSPTEPWLEDFKRAMASLKPAPSKPHGNRHVYVPKPLETCSHVYLRRDLILPPLAPPYDGPYEVLFRKSKIYKLKIKRDPPLKWHFGGKHFANDDEVQAEENHWLRRQDTAWYNSGIKKLLQRYQKCLDRNGDYLEK